LRGGVTQLSPKQEEPGRRRQRLEPHGLATVTPGTSALVVAFWTPACKALPASSATVAIAPLAGSNGVGDVAKELAYANSTGGFGVTLANGTEAFYRPAAPDLRGPPVDTGSAARDTRPATAARLSLPSSVARWRSAHSARANSIIEGERSGGRGAGRRPREGVQPQPPEWRLVSGPNSDWSA
jgi:hypothetical protein